MSEKFKVGDNVRVIHTDPDWDAWMPSMDDLPGKTLTVASTSEIAYPEDDMEPLVFIDGWWVPETWVELAQ